MMMGRVKWFNKDQGYGFIETDKYMHIFVQCAGIEDGYCIHDLEENETVAVLEVRETLRGPQATRVQRVERMA